MNTAIVEVQMMIRRPIEDVFKAFIDPEITRKFWFSRSSGKLEEGARVTWHWDAYGVSAEVQVEAIIPLERIQILWGDPSTQVDFEFTELERQNTLLVIKNHGFHQVGEALIETIKDNTGGFTTVLDGLKAYLEHGIELGLIADKFPPDPSSA